MHRYWIYTDAKIWGGCCPGRRAGCLLIRRLWFDSQLFQCACREEVSLCKILNHKLPCNLCVIVCVNSWVSVKLWIKSAMMSASLCVNVWIGMCCRALWVLYKCSPFTWHFSWTIMLPWMNLWMKYALSKIIEMLNWNWLEKLLTTLKLELMELTVQRSAYKL